MLPIPAPITPLAANMLAPAAYAVIDNAMA